MAENKRELLSRNVVCNSTIVPGVHLLEFDYPGSYMAGQVVAISISKELPPRLYSLVSGSNDTRGKILFDIHPNGCLTPLLAKLTKEDQILVSAPFGDFVDNKADSFWIATGTGVAPFVSMVNSNLCHGKTLVHGARTLEGFYFQTLFQEKLQGNYHRFCTTSEGDGVKIGRLTSWLQVVDLQTNIKYYLCGSASMVVEVRDLLLNKGVPFDNIIAEIYF